MTYLTRNLACKQIACFSLPRIVLLLSSAPSLRCTLQFISVLSDLGKSHRVSCLQSPPVIFKFGVSGIISNSILLRNLDTSRLFSLSYQMIQSKGSSASALPPSTCCGPLYCPTLLLYHLLLSQILRHSCDETNPRHQIPLPPLGSCFFFLIKHATSFSYFLLGLFS